MPADDCSNVARSARSVLGPLGATIACACGVRADGPCRRPGRGVEKGRPKEREGESVGNLALELISGVSDRSARSVRTPDQNQAQNKGSWSISELCMRVLLSGAFH